MIQRMLLGLFVLSSCALSAHAAGTPAVEAAPETSQAPDKAAQLPDKRPEVEKLTVRKLKGHVDKKGAEDTDAVQVIDSLNQEFPNSGPKDRQAIVSALGKCLDARRQGVDEGIERRQALHRRGRGPGCGMGPESR